jgi:hypothetical protein
MEKTAREWLMELKPEHRDLAISNAEKWNVYPEFVFNHKCESLHRALIRSFSWEHCEKGFDFWEEIWNKLKSNTYYDEEAKS